MIKHIISDVDGTLIYKGESLNKTRFPVMLDRLDKKAVSFTVASGRHFRQLVSLFRERVLDINCICCDGAYTISKGLLSDAQPIRADIIEKVFNACEKHACIELHSIDKSYVFGASSLHLIKAKSRFLNLSSITKLEQIHDDIFMISIYGSHKINIPPELRLCYESCGICEYVSATASKLNAAKSLLKLLNSDFSQVLFFGDGANDAELIKICNEQGLAYTTYCADSNIFTLANHHTRDVIGTIIELERQNKI